MKRKSMKEISENVVKDYLDSGKRHLVITGERGIGKSTLVSYLLNGRTPEGLCSRLVKDDDGSHPVRVVMKRWGDDSEFVIGLPEGGRCRPVKEGFHRAETFIRQMCDSTGKWFVVDEIGYMESSCPDYCQQLNILFDTKNVLAVLRKDSHDFLASVRSRRDVFLADLDAYKM